MDIFETAARKKLRFPSNRGDLTTEQLFDLSLTDLDNIARGVNSRLKVVTEESFIDTTPPHRAKPRFTLQLKILKHIIVTKQEEAQAVKDRVERAERRRKNEALGKKSRAQLLKELEALDD